MRENHKNRVLKVFTLTAVIGAANAHAELEEVTVTAQKRSESLQDVPIAVNAIDADDIARMHIVNAQDIAQASPYIQMPTDPRSANNPALFIRGIGNLDAIVLTKDPTVGIYYDGVYAARSTGLLADLAELERVEVLRGPQGTLYGRNTTAGAINFITSRPSGVLGFEQKMGFGDYGSWRSVSRLNLPAMAGLSATLTAAFSAADGWVKNDGPNKLPGLAYNDFDKRKNEGYRVALRYDGIDNLQIDYTFDHSSMTTTTSYFQYEGAVGIPSLAGPPITGSFDKRLESTLSPITGEPTAYYLPESRTQVDGHNLTAEWKIDETSSIKAITGYRKFDDNFSQNFAQSFGGAGNLEVNTVTDHKQFSEELQLLGGRDRFKYVAGLYYFDEKGTQTERQYLDRAIVDSTGVIALDLNTFTPCSDGSTSAPLCSDFRKFFPYYLGEYAVDVHNESWAAFGQGTWTPAILDNALDLTLGLRFTHDQRRAVRTNDGLLWNSFSPGESRSSLDKPDYSLIADYRWTDTISSYAKVSTGFRSGGSSRNGLNFNQSFREETLRSYEIGWKAEFLDQSLRFNGAIHDTRIEHIILDYLPDPVFNPQFVEVFNSGNADIRGFEGDVQWAVTRTLLLGLSYSYLEYDIRHAIFPDGSDRTKTTELVWAPRNSVSLNADWYIPVSFGNYDVRLDYTWQDDHFATSGTEAGKVIVGASGQLNGRVSLSDFAIPKGKLEVAFWVRNITDEDRATYKIGATAATYMQPRTFGAEVVLRY